MLNPLIQGLVAAQKLAFRSGWKTGFAPRPVLPHPAGLAERSELRHPHLPAEAHDLGGDAVRCSLLQKLTFLPIYGTVESRCSTMSRA